MYRTSSSIHTLQNSFTLILVSSPNVLLYHIIMIMMDVYSFMDSPKLTWNIVPLLAHTATWEVGLWCTAENLTPQWKSDPSMEIWEYHA